jgi:hypothetical protein
MRLKILLPDEARHQPGAAQSPGFVHGPTAISRHRPAFFGRHYQALLRRYLERSQAWSKGEMELFAAFVSSLNRCKF